MAIESRPLFQDPVDIACQQIREQGSPNEPVMTRLEPGMVCLVAGTVPLLFANQYLLPEGAGLASSAVYILGGMALGVAYDMHSRRRVADKSLYLEGFQEEVREYVDEPVDLYRVRPNNRLIMRWHALDDFETLENDNALDVAERLRYLATFAREQNIQSIAMDGSWLHGRITAKVSNELAYSGSYVDTAQFNKLVGHHDNRVLATGRRDQKIFIASPAICDTIARRVIMELRSGATGEALLADYIASSDMGFADAYKLWQSTGSPEDKDKLVYRLSRDIERHLQDSSTPMARRGDGYSNGGVRHIRGNDTVFVRGGHVSTQTAYLVDNRTETLHQSSDVLRAHGIQSAEDVMSSLAEGSSISLADAKAVLYTLLLAESDYRTYVGKGSTTDDDGATDILGQNNPTLFDRIKAAYQDGNPAMGLAFNLRKHNVRPSMTLKGNGLSLGAVVLAATLAVSTGYYLRTTEATTRSDLRAGTEQAYGTATPDFIERYTNETTPWGGRILLDSGEALAEFDSSINTAAKKAWNSLFGGKSGVLAQDQVIAAATLPENPYFTASGKEPIGDVSEDIDKEKVIYSVKQLGDEPTNGYWYTGVLDELDVEFTKENGTATYPFENVSVGFSESDHRGLVKLINFPQTPPNQSEAIFEVTSPYVIDPTQQGFYFPIKQNTAPVAGQYVYEMDGKTFAAKLDVSYEHESGMYHAKSIPVAEGMHNLRLQYWLGKSDDVVTARNPFIFPSGTDPAVVSGNVRAALGVSAAASPDAVARAIASNKYYSFAPFVDNGQKPVSTPLRQQTSEPLDVLGPAIDETTVTPTLSVIGETIAGQSSLNCNLAAAALIFATEGGSKYPSSDGSFVPYANRGTGFYDNGDGQLRIGEAHAWVVDSSGNELDATPGRPFPKPSMFDEVPLTGLVLGGVGVIMAGFALRRRRQVQEYLHERRFTKVLNDPLSAVAFNAAQEVLYAPPDKPASVFKKGSNPSTPQIGQAHIDTLTEQNYRSVRRQLKTRGMQTSLGVRRALRRLIRVANHNGKSHDYDLQIAAHQ